MKLSAFLPICLIFLMTVPAFADGPTRAVAASAVFVPQANGSKKASIPDIPFKELATALGKAYAIENVSVVLAQEGTKYFATVDYITNATYGGGSDDKYWQIGIKEGDLMLQTPEMPYAAFCQPPDQRIRSYHFKFEIPKHAFAEGSGIATPIMENTAHGC